MEVYRITNKMNGKIYIGITNQGVATRWYKHVSDANSDSIFPIHNAIRKYGKENFQIETIHLLSEDCDYEDLKNYERFWIAHYDSYNREIGYNLTLGGDGTFGRFHSEETRDKIRQKAIGRKRSEESVEKQKQTIKRNGYSKEILNIRSENGRRTRKAVLQLSITGDLINEFSSISEAAQEIGLDRRTINSVLTNSKPNHVTAGGFKWEYKE